MANISLNNSSSLSFLNVYARPIRSSPTDGRPTPFLRRFFPPPEIPSFWGNSIAITPFGTQKVFPTLMGSKYSIGSSLLTSSPSMTLTQVLFYITPALTSPLLPPLSPYLAPGKCFRTWILITYQFYLPFLFLLSSTPTNVPLPSISDSSLE